MIKILLETDYYELYYQRIESLEHQTHKLYHWHNRNLSLAHVICKFRRAELEVYFKVCFYTLSKKI